MKHHHQTHHLCYIVSSLLIASCSSSTQPDVASGSGQPSGESREQAEAASASTPSAATRDGLDAGGAAPGEPLLEAKRPFPGKRGPLPVYLDDRHTLHVGEHTIEVEHVDPEEHAYDWDDQTSLTVVDFDQARAAVLLVTPIGYSEDPPNRQQLFLLESPGLRRIFDDTPGSPLKFPGDGSMRYTENAYAACARSGHPADTTLQKVIFRLDETGAAMEEVGREMTSEKVNCAELPACPFVYVVDGDETVFAGEILRNLRGRDAYALQSLDLPARAGRTLRLRISEEKAETTYLDELYVEVDGVPVRPVQCGSAAPPAYCRADRKPLRLRQGEVLDIEVRLPADAGAAELRVLARGYYVPTPRTAPR